jgi:hypothetical protein
VRIEKSIEGGLNKKVAEMEGVENAGIEDRDKRFRGHGC